MEQADWFHPDKDAWVARILEEVACSTRPAVLVGHSLGVAAILHAAARVDPTRVAGGYLVAPADLEARDRWPPDAGQDWEAIAASFAPMPALKLPFPTRLIASSDDGFCSVERAQSLGAAWGADVSIVTDAGHINSASGHGPWPEGLLTFGQFLRGLDLPS